MKPILKYLWIAIKHKWYVFLAGLRVDAHIWDLIIHDWHKFTWAELPHYGRQFYGDGNDPDGWAKCWLHHQNLGKHHREYWVMRSGAGTGRDGEMLEIPDQYLREMVADWLAAGKAYEGSWPDPNNWGWWNHNKKQIEEDMPADTFGRLLEIIKELQED